MAAVAAAVVACPGPARAASAGGKYHWPVQGAVIRPFEEPPSPYEAGHRGIDIAAPLGTTVVASAKGTVSFAGWVAGSLFVSIQHANGVRTTYSWLSSISVGTGQSVAAREPIGRTGHGHAEESVPHLHFGVRIDGVYVDPMTLLGPGSVVGVIRLAPLEGDAADQEGAVAWAG